MLRKTQQKQGRRIKKRGRRKQGNKDSLEKEQRRQKQGLKYQEFGGGGVDKESQHKTGALDEKERNNEQNIGAWNF
jgi:hypothetical protein